jgi:hypothetical protein
VFTADASCSLYNCGISYLVINKSSQPGTLDFVSARLACVDLAICAVVCPSFFLSGCFVLSWQDKSERLTFEAGWCSAASWDILLLKEVYKT